jgi:type II secretory pathway pseudopilin PulG
MFQFPDTYFMQRYSRNASRGFTLGETIVVVAIIGAVGVAVTSMITFFYRSNAYAFQQTSAVDSAHRGLDGSFRNMREASYGDDGSYPVESAATSSVTFYSDVDNDGPVEKVRLYILAGTLYRQVTNSAGSPPSYTGQTISTSTIATNVVNATSTPVFRYYDTNGTELTAPADVSKVVAVATTLSVDLNPSRAPDIFTLQASATLRNLR